MSSTIQSTFWGGQWVMINLENNNLAFHHNSNVYSVYIQSMWHMKGNNNIFKSWRNNLINLKNHYCKLYSNFAQSVTEEGQVSRQLDWRIVTNEGPWFSLFSPFSIFSLFSLISLISLISLQFPSTELFPLHKFQKWDCRCRWAYSFGIGEIWWMVLHCTVRVLCCAVQVLCFTGAMLCCAVLCCTVL